MTIACALPDGDLGIALRLSTWIDCTARALGENGFQALAGGPVAASLLSGLTTVFVALIGYRMILGGIPSLRDGVGWAVRLGVVLALVTAWPAFQVLVYRVAVDAPVEIAALLLPATGLPGEGVEIRVQQAYDTIRQGASLQPPSAVAPADPSAGAASQNNTPPIAATLAASLAPVPPGYQGQPQTASLFVVATLGLLSATRIAAGFLLAIAPLAILTLLFDGTIGLFNGWLRALAGAALAQVAMLAATAAGLIAVEGELAHLQAAQVGAAATETVDPQALATTVLIVAALAVGALWAASRMAGAIRVDLRGRSPALVDHYTSSLASSQLPTSRGTIGITAGAPSGGVDHRSRAVAVADALTATLHREQASGRIEGGDRSSARRITMREGRGEGPVAAAATPLGTSARRTSLRRSSSGATRDARR